MDIVRCFVLDKTLDATSEILTDVTYLLFRKVIYIEFLMDKRKMNFQLSIYNRPLRSCFAFPEEVISRLKGFPYASSALHKYMKQEQVMKRLSNQFDC